MEENNLKVGTNNHSGIKKEVPTQKASTEVPRPNSNKVNSAVLATKESFIMESVSVAWNLLRWRPWYVVLIPILISMLAGLIVVIPIFMVITLITITLSLIIVGNSTMAMITGVGVLLLFVLVLYLVFKLVVPAAMFKYVFIRDLLLGKNVNIEKTIKLLVRDGKLVRRFVMGVFLVSLVVVGGVILFIIPGIIWAIKYMFVPLLILDKNIGVKEAFGASGRITNGYKWLLFAYSLLIGIVGMMFLGNIFGTLVVAPIYLISYVFVYLVFTDQVEAVKSKTVKAPSWQIVTLIIVSILLNILSVLNNIWER